LGGLGLPGGYYPTGDKPTAVVSADVNHDGKPDVVTANFSSNNVSILVGTGTGALLPPIHVAVGAGPVDLAVGSLFTGGGTLQILTASQALPGVSVLTQSGLLWGLTNFPVGGLTPNSVSIGDANGDAALDAVTTNGASGDITVFASNGVGGFASSSPVATFGNPVAGAFADVQRDGIPDFVTAHSTGDAVNIVMGPLGTSPLAVLTFAAGSQPSDVVAADLNGDGWTEVLTTNLAANNVSVLLGATPVAYNQTMQIVNANSARGVSLGDLNGDGNADLASAHQPSGNVYVNLATGGGVFAAGTSVAMGGSPIDTALCDFNLDGNLDLLTTATTGVSVFRPGLGDGTFGASLGFPGGITPAAIATSDVDNDGKPDFLVARNSPGSVSIYKGNGNGTVAGFTSHAVGMSPTSIDFGDLNGDGFLDFATANSLSTTVSICYSNGAGGFLAHVPFGVAANPLTVSIGDLDADGILDFVTANVSANSMTIRRGLGGGNFASNLFVNFPLAGTATAALVNDMNGDGRGDLVGCNGTELGFVFLGNGAMGFTPTVSLGGFAAGLQSLALGDLTGDGRVGIAIGDASSGAISTFVNNIPNLTGIAAYGTGTPGCGGTLGISSNTMSRVNTPGFLITCTNGPRRSLGLCILANAQDVGGSDPFFLGIELHVDLFNSTEVIALDFISDQQGNGYVPAPTPNIPALAGLTFYAQGLWLERFVDGQACSTAPDHLTMTRGLAITVQP
jgi:hypothetical protein